MNKIFILKRLSDILIIRHVKVKQDTNPFNPVWDDYFERRYKLSKINKKKLQKYCQVGIKVVTLDFNLLGSYEVKVSCMVLGG